MLRSNSNQRSSSTPMTDVVIDVYRQMTLQAIKKDFVRPFKQNEIIIDVNDQQDRLPVTDDFVIDIQRKADCILKKELMTCRSEFVEVEHNHHVNVLKVVMKFINQIVLKIFNFKTAFIVDNNNNDSIKNNNINDDDDDDDVAENAD
jgi:hypothetical protein